MTRTWAVVLGAIAVVATVAAVVLGVLYLTDDSDSEAAATQPAPRCEGRIFGHVASMKRKGDGYEIRFDPAWFTSGITANTAAAEDGVVAPGEPVPNDNYRIEEGHRLLTYVLPSGARVTVLTRHGDPANFGATKVTADQLAQLVRGGKPVDLFEGLETGFWMRYHVDTVCSLEQQYQP